MYKRVDNSWSVQVKLVAYDEENIDNFGTSVAIFKSLILVGSSGDDDIGESSGEIFLFASFLLS